MKSTHDHSNVKVQGLIVSEHKGVPEVFHVGATAGYRTFLARYPEQHVSMAILCNVSNVNTPKVGRQAAQVFLAGHLKEDKPPGVNVSVQELESKAGLYRNPDTHEVQHFFVKGGKLMVGFEEATELTPTAPNKFRTADAPVEVIFEGGPSGEPLQMQVRRVSERYPPTVYTAVVAANPSRTQLTEYAGSYYSEELDVTYTVTVKNGKLLVRLRPAPEVQMEPTYADAFRVRAVTFIKFTRDAMGKVDGFDIFTGRIRRLRFVRHS